MGDIGQVKLCGRPRMIREESAWHPVRGSLVHSLSKCGSIGSGRLLFGYDERGPSEVSHALASAVRVSSGWHE